MNYVMKVKVEVNPILKRIRQLKDFMYKNREHLSMEQLDEVGEIICYNKNTQSPYRQRSEHANRVIQER